MPSLSRLRMRRACVIIVWVMFLSYFKRKEASGCARHSRTNFLCCSESPRGVSSFQPAYLLSSFASRDFPFPKPVMMMMTYHPYFQDVL